ncbi:MAG TPA: SirB2 family protein [Psychrobacter pasteurii]|nr:SirB2 family protein [Psychrobacter pasteurii]
MKHLHMLMAVITVVLFLWQSYLLMSKGTRFDKKGKIATHVVYTLLIISGVLNVMPLLSANASLQWVVAKIILLLAAISASIKAFRATATPAQSKSGIFIAFIAYVAIFILAFVKPGSFM